MYCIVCGWMDTQVSPCGVSAYPGTGTCQATALSCHNFEQNLLSHISRHEHSTQQCPGHISIKNIFWGLGFKVGESCLNTLVVFTCTWQNLQSWIEEMAVTSHFNPCKIIFPTVAGERGWFCTGLASGGVDGMGKVGVWRYIPEQKRDVCTMYVFLPQTLKLMSFDILQYRTHFHLWNKPREH